jgi:hypothetical protein
MDYLISRYSTGQKESPEEALSDLQDYMSSVSTDLAVVKMDVVPLRRDWSLCVGYVLLSGGLNVFRADHIHVVPNINLTQDHTLTLAGCHHANTAQNIQLLQDYFLSVQDSHHASVAGNVVVTQENQSLFPANCHHDNAGENIDLM